MILPTGFFTKIAFAAFGAIIALSSFTAGVFVSRAWYEAHLEKIKVIYQSNSLLIKASLDECVKKETYSAEIQNHLEINKPKKGSSVVVPMDSKASLQAKKG